MGTATCVALATARPQGEQARQKPLRGGLNACTGEHRLFRVEELWSKSALAGPHPQASTGGAWGHAFPPPLKCGRKLPCSAFMARAIAACLAHSGLV